VYERRKKRTTLSVQVSESVVAELVHQTVEHCVGARSVDGETLVLRVVVFFLDARVSAACNPHHPQELVDIIGGVTDVASKDDQHIVHIQRLHDFIGLVFTRCHSLIKNKS